jgi:probable rRNA maturation factor
MPNAVMPSPEVSILFRYPPRGSSRNVRRRPLLEFLKETSRQIAPGRSIACLITDDLELQALNLRFRRKDSPTDVLSFPSSNGSPAGGEMAISLDRAAAQALRFNHSIEDELRILMLHGLLHLAGMDHESDAGEMERTEARWRKRLKLPPGLVERTGA